MTVHSVRSVFAPPPRRWWRPWGAWADLAEIVVWCRLQADYDYQDRLMAELVGEEALARLRALDGDLIFGRYGHG